MYIYKDWRVFGRFLFFARPGKYRWGLHRWYHDATGPFSGLTGLNQKGFIFRWDFRKYFVPKTILQGVSVPLTRGTETPLLSTSQQKDQFYSLPVPTINLSAPHATILVCSPSGFGEKNVIVLEFFLRKMSSSHLSRYSKPKIRLAFGLARWGHSQLFQKLRVEFSP